MKSALWIVLALALTLTLAACGSGSSTSNNLNGNWTATLSNTAGTTVYAFTTSLAQSSTGVVSGTFSFTTGAAPCFEELGSETGQITVGSSTSSVQLILTGGQPGAISLNTLNLTGTLSGNTLSGSWILQGTIGCTGSGNFTMTKS
jgi:hypothetical protein